MTKFTKEFIAEQRRIWERREIRPPLRECNYYTIAAYENYGAALDEIERRGALIECLHRSARSRLKACLHNYYEIKRLENLIAEIKHTLKSDSEKYSWEVAGVNALRCIELNMEGGEE